MFEMNRLKAKFQQITPLLNERQLRLVAAAEAKSIGHGGIKAVSEACGLSRRSIERAKRETATSTSPCPAGRVRRPGGGRKKLTTNNSGLSEALDRLVEPVTRGEPMSPLRWTSKSTAKRPAS